MHWGWEGDDGIFVTQAARVMHGQLPGVDLFTMYPGMNLFYLAGWFALFGMRFQVAKLALLAMLMLIAALIYGVVRSCLSPRWANGATLFAVSVVVTFYPALSANWDGLAYSLASWLALRASLHSERTSKQLTYGLLACGFFLGMAFFAKQTVGLYSGFTVLITLALAQCRVWAQVKTNSPQTTTGILYWRLPTVLGKAFLITGLLLIPLYFLEIMKPHAQLSNLLMFAAPSLLVTGATAWLIRQCTKSTDDSHFFAFGELAGS